MSIDSEITLEDSSKAREGRVPPTSLSGRPDGIELDQDELDRVEFDPKLRTYWFWQGAFILLVTVFGVLVLPIWLLGLGQIVSRRKFRAMTAGVSRKSLYFSRGVWFRTEKTIPLEQIQDLTLREGPLLKALGLCSLAVETAGQNATSLAEARLIGIRDARHFRNRVLERRDALRERSQEPSSEVSMMGSILEIRDDLSAIRRLLEDRGA